MFVWLSFSSLYPIKFVPSVVDVTVLRFWNRKFSPSDSFVAMNLLLKEQFIICGGDRLDTTSWKLSWLAGRRAGVSTVFRGPAIVRAWRCQRTTPNIAVRNWIKAQFCESPQSCLFLYNFFSFSHFAFYIKCLFFTHTRRYILFHCLFQFCLSAGTVVFTRLCNVYLRLLSLSSGSIVFYA